MDLVTVYLFVLGVLFLVGSVCYNRQTGWKPAPRPDYLTEYLSWRAELKANLAPQDPAPSTNDEESDYADVLAARSC